MWTSPMTRKLAAITAALLLAFSVASFAQTPPAARKEHAFKGKVESINEKGKMVTVNNESIPDRMMSMTMTYKVDNDAVLKTLKPGDQISATVYDGDFQVLYNIKVLPPAKK